MSEVIGFAAGMTSKARAPSWLDEHARRFWNKYHAELVANGTLTPTDEPNFELMAVNWSILRRIDPQSSQSLWINTQKVFQQQLKMFGLTPTERRKGTNPTPPGEPDEFGI